MDEFSVDIMGDAMNINLALGEMIQSTDFDRNIMQNQYDNDELNYFVDSQYNDELSFLEQQEQGCRLDEEYNYYADVKLEQGREQPCEFCKRTFLPEILERHRNVCYKQWLKSRNKQSKMEKDLVAFCNANEAPKSLSNFEKIRLRRKERRMQWRARHEDFVAAVRAAREYALAKKCGKELPAPPAPTVNREHVKCETCKRSFNRGIISRHIEHCKEKQKNQAFDKKTYSTAQIEAKRRLATRLTYTPSASPADSLLNSMFNSPQSSRPISRAASCFPSNYTLHNPSSQRPFTSMSTTNVLTKAANILTTQAEKPQSRLQALRMEHIKNLIMNSSLDSPQGSNTRSVTPTPNLHLSPMNRQISSPTREGVPTNKAVHTKQTLSPGRPIGSQCHDVTSIKISPEKQQNIPNSNKQAPQTVPPKANQTETIATVKSVNSTLQTSVDSKISVEKINLTMKQKSVSSCSKRTTDTQESVDTSYCQDIDSINTESNHSINSTRTVVGINNVKLELGMATTLEPPKMSGDMGQSVKSQMKCMSDSVPKFCYDCGSKYNTIKAKFCGECGCKRIIPDEV